MVEGMKILLVEDEREIAHFIINGLKVEHFTVDHFRLLRDDYGLGLFRSRRTCSFCSHDFVW